MTLLTFVRSTSRPPQPSPSPITYQRLEVKLEGDKHYLYGDGEKLVVDFPYSGSEPVVCDIEGRACIGSALMNTITFNWRQDDDVSTVIGTLVFHFDLAFFKVFFELISTPHNKEFPMTDKRTQSNFWHDVEAELAKPEAATLLQRIPNERANRAVEISAVPVIEWTPNPSDPSAFSLMPPEGGVTLFWGRNDRSTIRQLYTAYLSHDIEALEGLKDAIAKEYEGRPVLSVEDAVTTLCGSPFFDFRYAGKILADNLFLPDASVGAMVFPYSGATLANRDFSIASYLRSGESLPYEVFAVVNRPVLTAVEAAAVAAVPHDNTEMHVAGSNLLLATPTALATVVVFAAIATCVCGLAFRDRAKELKLSKDVLSRLKSTESLTELLRLRQSLFQEFGITK